MNRDVYILSSVRTPIGSFLGGLKNVPAPRLGAAVIQEAVKRARIDPDDVDECLMGCVLTAGVGQAPARQAAIFAGLSKSVLCTTVNRVCGSGLKTVMLASQAIQCQDADIIVAGGMESMSQSPYLLGQIREGYRLGNGQIIDSMIHDGLWDVYHQNHMGDCAELCAGAKKFSREDQDRYAKLSYTRALESIRSGKFKSEIVGVEVLEKKEKRLFDTDEEPSRAQLNRFSELKPAFQKNGTVTAANASSLSDGASALVLCGQRTVDEFHLKPQARLLGFANHAQEPEWFTTAPVEAIQKLLKKTGVVISDIDLFEINEAFSVVALACIQELGLQESRVNVRGGAVAMGHPIGASGARILTTLIHTLKDEGKRLGVAAICIGGGEAGAALVEVVHST